MIEKKYSTSLSFDLKFLETLNSYPVFPDNLLEEEKEEIEEIIDSCKSLWHLKLALIHRVNQKEILE